MPNGQQRLISRGVYSLHNNQSGQITFQLHGNGYRFAAGHTVELQLLGRDAPYYQAEQLRVHRRSLPPHGPASDAN